VPTASDPIDVQVGGRGAEPAARVGAAVLAAGGGSRFEGEGHKLLASVRGRPVVAWAVAAAVESGLDPVFVVTGAVDLVGVLNDAGLGERVRWVDHPGWEAGQATSLARAVTAASGAGLDGLVVGLGDQPFIAAEAWRRVGAVTAARPILVATYGGRRRNPVGFHRSVWSELPVAGDEGARRLLARRPELVGEVPCPGEPADVDTLEDLTRWRI
jgi:molybdenum cofactor cytidylyltransferase